MNRPKIKLKKSKSQLGIEVLTFSLIIFSMIIIGIFYEQLPDKIPIHFNWPSKDINNLGAKNVIFFMPIICILMVVAIFKLNQFPWIFNYPFEINEKNAAYHYKQATAMLRILNLLIGIVCFYFTLTSILRGLGHEILVFNKFEILLPILFIGIPIIFLIQILAKNKTL